MTTGISFFGIAGTSVFAEVKAMYNWGTGETTGSAATYTASPSGTVTVKTNTDGTPGNCSIIEVFVEKVNATGSLGVGVLIPADAIIRVKTYYIK